MQTGLILVHGGGHRAACWELVLPHLSHPAVTLDLPGRGDRRAVGMAGVEDFVDAVVAAVDSAPFERAVLVTHSLSGIVAPGVARIRPDRIAHLVFVAATIPAEGQCALDMVPSIFRPFTCWQARRGRPLRIPSVVARWLFGHDAGRVGARQLVAQLSPESARVLLAPVSWEGVPARLPRTYVLCTSDRAMPPAFQRRQIANLGLCGIVTLESGHDPFISRPTELAEILNIIARGG